MEKEKSDNYISFEDRLTALGESEMAMFRFLLDKPFGVILTVETDRMLAQLLEREGLVICEPGDKVIMPEEVRAAYEEVRSDELTLRWCKRNWMYKCIEAGKYLYGVMTYDALRDLFALRYPNADMTEVMELFDSTPLYYQWFTEHGGKLVLNGFEQDDYYRYLEQVQGDLPFYAPAAGEVEELYEQGSLISRESHQKMREFIEEHFGCDPDTAALKVHDLYETVNNNMRVNDAVEAFIHGGSGADGEVGDTFEFGSDEERFRFTELYIEMSRECRIRNNRGHDYYEMVAIMSLRNGPAGSADRKSGTGSGEGSGNGSTGSGRDRSKGGTASAINSAQVRRVKIGRNDPCPCGSGKKYKNCCGKN